MGLFAKNIMNCLIKSISKANTQPLLEYFLYLGWRAVSSLVIKHAWGLGLASDRIVKTGCRMAWSAPCLVWFRVNGGTERKHIFPMSSEKVCLLEQSGLEGRHWYSCEVLSHSCESHISWLFLEQVPADRINSKDVTSSAFIWKGKREDEIKYF